MDGDSAGGPPLAPPQTWRERLDDEWERLDRWRRRPAFLAASVVAALAVAGAWWWTTPRVDQARIDELIPQVTLEATTPTTAVPEPLVVHVVGAVADPGVYHLDPGSRVLDAVEAAGGPTADADLAQLNLAGPAADGSQIVVAAIGEVVAQPIRGADPSASSGSGGLVDLNTADEAVLDDLPGVGPATAAAIVSWREESGPFTRVDDLLSVPGIGPAKLDGLRDLVVVG